MSDETTDETLAERQARIHDLSRERPAPERIERSDKLEEMRSDRAEALEDMRTERARRLAVDDAIQKERTENRFVLLESKMKAMNAAIDRTGRQYETLNRSVTALDDRLDTIATTLTTAAAVDADRVRQEAARTDELKRANDNALTNRSFKLGVIAVVLTLLGVIASVLIGVHVI